MSTTFCVNPWITLHTKISSGFNPCCLFKDTMHYDTVNEYVNSTELAEVKQRLLNGEQITECSACWDQEKVGYTSKRQRDNQTYKPIFQILNQDTTKNHGKFVEYYLRLGNHCNLRCTSCNDSLSSGWISENKKFNISTTSVDIIPDDHDVWDYIEKNPSTIGTIEFIGGEPFMMNIERQVKLLKFLVDSKHSTHIRIKYNTNGTRLPNEQLELWPMFKAVEINVSIDGTHNQFEYLRFPAKWKTVDSNIKFYQELQKTIKQLELTVISTLSILNIGYVEDILNYCQQQNLNLFLNLLNDPSVLNLFKSSNNVKNWIQSRIQHIDHPVIKNIISNLYQTPSTVTERMLLDFLTPLDQRRGLDVKKTFPELVKCLESTI